MNRLSDELVNIRKQLKWLSEYDIKNESHPGGLNLACFDWIAEEVLVMDYLERVEKLYTNAMKRAETRKTDVYSIRTQCEQGYDEGMRVAFDLIFGEDLEDVLDTVLSESNYGFAFVCGVMSVLEAVKGKGYKASWQSEGELSALPNIRRKYDRLKSMQGMMPGTVALDEARPTTAADLAVYGTKLTTWYNEFDQEGFKAWIKEVQTLIKKEGTNDTKQETHVEGV